MTIGDGSLLPVANEPSPPRARKLGWAVLGASLGAVALSAMLARRGQAATQRERAARGLERAAALLAGSVLADSSVEHYRGAFENPGMYTPFATAGAVVAADGGGIGGRGGRDVVHLTALATGAAGTAFHVYNLLRREGGPGWVDLFYGAPLGAPAALSIAGLLGLAADRVRADDGDTLLGLPAGRALAGLAGVGIAGTVGEAWLLHFRGAFHNPAMWAPIALPPVASALLVRAAVAPGSGLGFTRFWLGATALMGVAGVGFHIYGVSRHMGGWRNWSQNLLEGPPIPAPPAFTALALAGLLALSLIEDERG